MVVHPAQLVNGTYIPNKQYLPIIQSGTQVTSNSGIIFELTEDVNFGKVDVDGNLTTEYKIFTQDNSGNPTRFVMKGIGLCSSARVGRVF